MAFGQLRLLLWKDYLIRKRKLITLAGVAWATMVVMCLYTVRVNVDNQYYPTCQFPARALPSAGMLTFLQSFVCSVNNECSPMEKYQEIPTYEDSQLTLIQRKLSPLLYNETVLDVTTTVPNALKLLATLADVMDHSDLIEISKNGLKVKDLFREPRRVKRYLISEMGIDEAAANTIMASELSIQGLLKGGGINRCNAPSISSLIRIEDEDTLNIFVQNLCQRSDTQVQKMAMDLLVEINFSKYLNMIGDMYHKLSGDDRITILGNLFTAVLRMTRLDSFLPPVVPAIFEGRQVESSYFNVTLITKLMDKFEPTFGNTQAYKILRDITDALDMGITYLDKILITNDPIETTGLILGQIGNKLNGRIGLSDISMTFNKVFDSLYKATANDSIDVYVVLTKITNLVQKFLPDHTKHEVLFYSTLLAKLIEGANRVVTINWDIEEMAYNVSLRNPTGINVLKNLPLHFVKKGYQGLADAERIQLKILTSKLNLRSQIFCDSGKLANFFRVSIEEVNTIKNQLCTDAWKNYVEDLIKSFGIFEVRDLINDMASIVIQETFGKDTSGLLYPIEKSYQILKDFIDILIKAKSKERALLDWNKLFNVTNDSELLNYFKTNQHLGKQIFITAHGALAKEVVKQNTILEIKISPILLDFTTILSAINQQLNLTPKGLPERMKTLYPIVIQTMLYTLRDEDKTYKALSIASQDIVCKGVPIASLYLDLSNIVDKEDFVDALCNTSRIIDAGLKNDSLVAKAIAKVKMSTHNVLDGINWTKLIDGLKNLYLKLDNDYPYLFEFSSYGMNREIQVKVEQMLADAKQFWFSTNKLDRGVHISIKLVFRLLDLIDSRAFNVTSEGWLKMKMAFSSTWQPLNVVNDFIRLLAAASQNATYHSDLPQRTSVALSTIVSNVPELIIDVADVILKGDTDVKPILSLMNSDPGWPCSSTSISTLVPLTASSIAAVTAAETVLCIDEHFQNEWTNFIQNKNLGFYNSSQWNVTVFESHEFLKFSGTFDAIIEDLFVIKDLSQELFDDSESNNGRLTILGAWKRVTESFDDIDMNTTLSTLFRNIDTILDGITTHIEDNSLNLVWEQLLNCSSNSYIEGECKASWRAVWKYSLEAISVVIENIASDLLTYFTEVNDPNANFLQLMGFTKQTGLYILYDKLPEFIGTLLNSFLDYGFMSQVRRASITDFWDCEEVLSALAAPPGSSIDSQTIEKVKPFVCPMLLHWLSMPRGDNTLLDIVSKPQHTFYTQQVQNLRSSYENAFIKTKELLEIFEHLVNKNDSIVKNELISIDGLQDKLKATVDSVFNYKINDTNQSYRFFHEINKKQFISIAYLTRITAVVNKLAVALENFSIEDLNLNLSEEKTKELKSELSTMGKIFKRRPNEAIAFFFDVITYMLSANNDQFSLVKGLNVVCDESSKNKSYSILSETQRTQKQVCAKDYKTIYGAIENVIASDLMSAKTSLMNLIVLLQRGEVTVDDIVVFFNNRKTLVDSLKVSTKYAYDLSLPIYLKYLQSNLKNYNVILTFLSGGNWWAELRSMYNGPHLSTFFNGVEQSFEISEDILTKLDKIQIVRLLREVNLNDTASFCQPNITLSDYMPDATGILSQWKQAICSSDKGEVFKEIPALVFASHGYDDKLEISKDVDYDTLSSDIANTEARLLDIKDGPRAPERPLWITDEKMSRLRTVALQLLSKETATKVAFGVLVNIVDAGTLFLNNSQCALCSSLTTWVKQINLQLYKKQEYDNLLCHSNTMSLEDIHMSLKNEFHWDMAIRELISSRNYTTYELNKSLNEMLEQLKLHMLEDVTSNSSKVADCLLRNVTANELGHTALLITVIAETSKLFRAELPHLREIDGIKEVPYFKEIQTQLGTRLDVYQPLNKYLKEKNTLGDDLRKLLRDIDLVQDIEESEINLRLIDNRSRQREMDHYINLSKHTWDSECLQHDCEDILMLIESNVNTSLSLKDLPKLQEMEFWEFRFVTNILYHVEHLLKHIGRLVGVASRMDVAGVMGGRLASMIDLAMEVLTDDAMDSVVYSIHGILEGARPLLGDTLIEQDLRSLTEGLLVLQQYKNYLLREDVKVVLREVFSGEAVERSLGQLGINNTNFWSVAAPRIHVGFILLTPVLSWKSGDHISNYVCQAEPMSRVIFPSNLDVVTQEDVFGATVEQFCGLSNERAKQIVPALVEGLNFTYLMDKLATVLLDQLYSASNLTHEEGKQVTASVPLMASVLPSIQQPVEEVAETLAKAPLLQALRNFSSIGGLLGSSDFLSGAGNMLCGRPFAADVSRLYRSVLQNKDFAVQPDEKQLDLLPTDFCRTLYKDIISVEGGKIVWSFIKPLVMGKILYTPQTEEVYSIIKRANTSFAHMAQLSELVHSFSAAFSSVDTLVAHREGLAVMKRLLSSPAFEDIKLMLLGEGELPDVDLDGMFDEFGDLQGVGQILSKASSLLRCVNLNRFQGAKDEQQLTHDAALLASVNELSAGVVFLNSDPMNVEYKIRMDIDNVPTTTRLKNYFWIPGPEANFLENMRYFRGFVQLQDLVDGAIIDLAKNTTQGRHKRGVTSPDVKWAMYTQQMPYPCYNKDFFQTSLYESQALMVAFFFSLLFTVASAVRFIVADTESGNTMLMGVMGVNLSYITFSWFLWCMLELVLTAGCMTIVLAVGGVLPRTDYTLVLALLVIFGLSVLSFCYMMSKLFTRASFAAVCTAIAYLVSFMPIVLILSLEAVISKASKILVCLSMSSALCYSFLHVSRLEARGAGADWSNLWAPAADAGAGSDDVSIGLAALMMLVDAALYFAIGWTLDYFYGPKTLQSCISHCVTTDEKAGVSIVNVSKVYNQGTRHEKVALDNVSIELHKGQVTTLLGHNGAGKTTLINILTGALRPTRGHVVVRSAAARRTPVGACPQRDVLYEHMTAREHIALYAQLKTGSSLVELRDEIDRLERVVVSGAARARAAARLSGGTRRRLCVALAFAGRPPLVTLDEPTAGVDPAARREIWTMIEALRAERTVLLCTHHLDEAELLSDQLVIMHKGQVHTVGSPIEIKRTLGQGYTLSALYPARSEYDGHEMHELHDEPIEERAKQLLTTVKEVVGNASLSDIAGQEVELTLPFYDNNGLNNNFLQVCCNLEAHQATLGFASYWLECTSLEQVLYNICAQVDEPTRGIECEETPPPSRSESSCSARSEAPLVGRGPLSASARAQAYAVLLARLRHHLRNRWLSFVLVGLPAAFVALAMAFSLVRPPADNELALPLLPDLYHSTDFLTTKPSVYSNATDPSFAESVMRALQHNYARNWTEQDTPTCACGESKIVCNTTKDMSLPQMMVLPDVDTLNEWLVSTQEIYIEKRYGGFSTALQNNITNIVTWYNNKGHHSMPAFISAANSAILRVVTGNSAANITTYSHPMKISKEQISKDTVYQHVADAGIAGLVLVAYCLVAAGGSVALVGARRRQEKRLQLLCGLSPATYWALALLWDMAIIVINMVITVILMEAFHFPVFVARNNLPAICLLILCFGFACGALTHVLEKLFSEASVANMVLFCGNAFVGLGGLTVLLILDLISESERTDNARWMLHKIFMLSPQFALGDGLMEIAKNTIQAQVLYRFGMDTYKDPLSTDLVAYHYLYMLVVGTALFLLNLAIEYQCFDYFLDKLRPHPAPVADELDELEDVDVSRERARVRRQLERAPSLRIRTIGNINAGFVDSEGNGKEMKKSSSLCANADVDVASCVSLGRSYGRRAALADLTLGLPPGQCTALVGENGAGKSTTFRLLTGQLRPTTGRLYLRATPASRARIASGFISYCPQSDAVDPLLSVKETLMMYCRLRGIDNREEVVTRTMQRFELSGHANTEAGELSGGGRRKLCAALALMSRAPLVLLDEPTSGMDPAARACVERGVRAACAERRAVLHATHHLRPARRHASRLALLRRARLRALATPARCHLRFGGGYVVECRVAGGRAAAAWRILSARQPDAALRVLHHAALHVLLPAVIIVDGKEVATRMSDIFRLMAELQGVCDIEDYTISQSSLEQMFLNFSDKNHVQEDRIHLEPLPTLLDEELNSITSL